MTDAVAVTARRSLLVGLLSACVAAVLAGCSIPAQPVRVEPAVFGSTSPPGMPGAAPATVVLRFGEHALTATLSGTLPSRQFAGMLPLTVQLRDVWGQAKSGRLPEVLTAEGSSPVHDPVPGGLYFWPYTEVIAVYYADLGLPVPGPGLVRLGVIDSGLDRLASAGEQVTVRIELATETPNS